VVVLVLVALGLVALVLVALGLGRIDARAVESGRGAR